MTNYPQLYLALAGAVWLYMTAAFLGGAYLKRDDVVDSAWGPGFIVVALLTLLIENNHSLVQILTIIFVTIWGLRLFIHISYRNSQKKEDHRYQNWKAKWGGNALTQAYLRIYMLQGLIMLLVSTPLVAILVCNHKFNQPLAILGFGLWGFGIFYESVADYQLLKFVQHKKPGQIMQSGLWRYSRHPNYFGEITLWWGAGLVALAANQWWALIGPATITFFLIKVSGVPLLEKHYATNPEYQKYKRRTLMLFPFPPKKN